MKLAAGFCFLALAMEPAFATDTYRFENLGAPKIAGQEFPNLCFNKGYLSRGGWVTFPARATVQELFGFQNVVDYTNVRYSDATGFETVDSIMSAVAVNDQGDVVLGGSWQGGSWRTSDGGVIWKRNGTFQQLAKPADPNSRLRVTSINNLGDYAGYVSSDSATIPRAAYVLSGNFLPAPGPDGWYTGLNNRGVAAFVYYSAAASVARFRSDFGFEMCPATINYYPAAATIEELPFFSINDSDEFVVTGHGTPAPILISSRVGVTSIPSPSSMKISRSSRFFINNHHQIAIRVSVDSNTDPWYVWDGTVYQNLGTAASSTYPSGMKLNSLYGIDDQGRVWGSFLDAQGNSQLGRFVPISQASNRRVAR